MKVWFPESPKRGPPWRPALQGGPPGGILQAPREGGRSPGLGARLQVPGIQRVE